LVRKAVTTLVSPPLGVGSTNIYSRSSSLTSTGLDSCSAATTARSYSSWPTT